MNKISSHKKNGDRKLNVMFGDFCYYNRHTLLSRYTPLGIGLIAQYATQQFGNDIKVSLFKSFDIDSQLDFKLVELLLKNKKNI